MGETNYAGVPVLKIHEGDKMLQMHYFPTRNLLPDIKMIEKLDQVVKANRVPKAGELIA